MRPAAVFQPSVCQRSVVLGPLPRAAKVSGSVPHHLTLHALFRAKKTREWRRIEQLASLLDYVYRDPGSWLTDVFSKTDKPCGFSIGL